MKRIKIRPGKYVTISAAVAEKAAEVAACVKITKEQVLEMEKGLPRYATILVGPPSRSKPSQRFRRTR